MTETLCPELNEFRVLQRMELVLLSMIDEALFNFQNSFLENVRDCRRKVFLDKSLLITSLHFNFKEI